MLYPNGPQTCFQKKNIPFFFSLASFSPKFSVHFAGDAHTAAAATWLQHDLVPVIAVEWDGGDGCLSRCRRTCGRQWSHGLRSWHPSRMGTIFEAQRQGTAKLIQCVYIYIYICWWSLYYINNSNIYIYIYISNHMYIYIYMYVHIHL